MRLTLRTMLAYLDNILEPEDAEKIGKRISESQVATDLMNRIRDAMRRLRLGAPGISDRSDGLDSNTVAEYLDNTLADGRVPDFEKVCFESDVHLAEVAAVHQVLALVLAEPAEVIPESRERMYQVPEASAAAAKAAGVLPSDSEKTAGLANGAGKAAGAKRRDGEDESKVPDFLREAVRPARGPRFLLAAVVVAVLAAAAAIWGRPFLANLSQKPAEAVAQADGENRESGGPAGSPIAAGGNEQPGASSKLDRQEPEAAAATQAGTPASGKGEIPAKGPQLPQVPPADVAKPEQTANTTPASGGRPANAPSDPRGANLPAAPDRPAASPRPSPAVPLPPRTTSRLGLLASADQALLRQDVFSGAYRRVAQEAVINAGDKLLSLPAFHPTISLAATGKLQLIDSTAVDLHAADADGAPVLIVEYGRVILTGDEKPGQSRLRMQVGEHSGTIRFTDPHSVVAIDAGRFDAHTGADPETQPAPLVVDLYVTSGKVTWQKDPDGKPVDLTAPVRVALAEASSDRVDAKAFPKWLYDSSPSLLDERAVPLIERSLTPERPVNLSLRELATHRLREVKGLAMRCLADVGDFEPLIQALNDPDERAVWPEYIELLRACVLRSTYSAAQVRTTMEKLYAERGANLYELLWKYQVDAIAPKDAEQLVRLLDDELMVFRVLSIWNLETITAMRYKYRAEDPANRRSQAIQRWKERLRSSPSLRARAVEEKPSGPSEGTQLKDGNRVDQPSEATEPDDEAPAEAADLRVPRRRD